MSSSSTETPAAPQPAETHNQAAPEPPITEYRRRAERSRRHSRMVVRIEDAQSAAEQMHGGCNEPVRPYEGIGHDSPSVLLLDAARRLVRERVVQRQQDPKEWFI